MRWFVEISPLGASEGQKQKWCLEAAGWQPALKDARSIRGEDGPLGGFSIELLDDGARAVDPVTRIRYVIRTAPDGAALTHAKDASGKSAPVSAEPAKADLAKVEPTRSDIAKVEPAKVDIVKSEPAKADLTKVEPSKSDIVKSEPAKVDIVKSEPAKADLAKVEPSKSDIVKSERAKTDLARVEPASDDVDIPVDEDGGGGEDAPLPEYQLLQAREEDPNERTPLTYREYVYAVDPALAEAEIERLLHARFAAVKDALASAKQGRFVNLAIFDHVFAGKPSKRPRATLTWKDWRGAPEIRFPAAERASLEPPSFAAPTSFSNAIPKPSIPPPEPFSAVPSTAMAPTEPAPAKVAAPTTDAPPAPASEKPAPASEKPAPAPAVTITTSTAPPTPAAATTPSPTSPEQALPVKIEAPVVVAIEAAPAPSLAQPAPPVSAAPKTMPAAAPAPAPPKSSPKPAPAAAPAAPREAFIPAVKTAAQAGKRMSGDELISELFEACGDLQFLRDSLEGADFVLSLALEKLPSEVGLVSLFDINRREFVVIRQAGGPRSIVLARLPERAALAQAAMRKKSAIVVSDASKEPRALDDRFRTLGIQLVSLMVAPVEVSGRYLGLIELCNPVDGRAFTEGDGHALTYIGEQYAEFVAERGVVIDPESVIERHQKR